MTYGELREVLMSMDEEHLRQTVTLYCLEEDEFVPAIGTDFTDTECQTIDPDHLVISFSCIRKTSSKLLVRLL